MTLNQTVRTGTSDLHRGITECKRGCKHIINLLKNETGDLLTDPNTILNRWKN
jgi:hypothetical protein